MIGSVRQGYVRLSIKLTAYSIFKLRDISSIELLDSLMCHLQIDQDQSCTRRPDQPVKILAYRKESASARHEEGGCRVAEDAECKSFRFGSIFVILKKAMSRNAYGSPSSNPVPTNRKSVPPRLTCGMTNLHRTVMGLAPKSYSNS